MITIETVKRFIQQIIFHYQDKQCQKSAAALTYMTLFAIVPMMTVSYSMFSVIPAFSGLESQLQALIFNNFVPSTGQEVQQYLSGFSSQARSLTSVGVIMLVVTAYLMLKNIEGNFNSIWGVKEGRKGLANFLLYWAVLSLGPLLLGMGLAVTTYLLSLKLFEGVETQGFFAGLLGFLPFVLATAAFTLLFVAVPNCKVNLKHAAIGGLLTAIAFELVKKLFATVVGMTSLEVIYGAFAVVPLFLVWIYVMWMLVLSGAILVRVLSTFSQGAEGQHYPDLVAALLVLWAFHQRWQQGESLTDRHAAEVGVDGRQWAGIRESLIQQQIIAATSNGDYVLSKDLSRVRLRSLAGMVGIESQLPGESRFLQSLPWFPSVAARMLAIDQKTELEYDVCLTEVFDTVPQTLELPEEDALISDEGVFPIHQAKHGNGSNDTQ
ncbi:YihY family inner membrane protein [uncultured Pseudoteredinibacter sp.]|uniref:YihY family inner membrane protein n=1 Tax=uncultured Pseudoteredinibacter sp. TaxID=1641701 RepID=UPI0026303C1E|nr:YihY family inner membrane protein [uncultured Pseudoteredinibacter sp.]